MAIMNYKDYEKYVSSKTMMGPNCVRILEELFCKYPLRLSMDDTILELGCGTGLTSLAIAKETGAKVYANDLWISAEDNERRFAEWGIDKQAIPVCGDVNELHFEDKYFNAVISIDSYHYFAGQKGFFQDKIMPFIKDGGIVLIGIPGLKMSIPVAGKNFFLTGLAMKHICLKVRNSGKKSLATTTE